MTRKARSGRRKAMRRLGLGGIVLLWWVKKILPPSFPDKKNEIPENGQGNNANENDIAAKEICVLLAHSGVRILEVVDGVVCETFYALSPKRLPQLLNIHMFPSMQAVSSRRSIVPIRRFVEAPLHISVRSRYCTGGSQRMGK